MGAAIYSLVETAKRGGVEPFGYLRDILVRVRLQPADAMDELLPRRWKERREAGELPPLPH
ncbi:MAG: transposase domain-containing protein [Planctomycetota bacterium]